MIHEAEKDIFKTLETDARTVPIIIVRTKTDKYMNEKETIARNRIEEDERLRQQDWSTKKHAAMVQAKEELHLRQQEDQRELHESLGLNEDFAPFVYVSNGLFLKYLLSRCTKLTPRRRLGVC